MLTPDAWLVACRRLIHEAGRARIHDLRGSLNMAALGAELIADDGHGPDDSAHARAARSIKRGVTEASDDLRGLHSLIIETTDPGARSFADAADWALEAAGPVGRRRGLTVEVAAPLGRLPAMAMPDGFSVMLAWCLIEAFLAAPRRSRVLVEPRDGDDASLVVEWTASVEDRQGAVQQAGEALSSLLDGRGRVALDAGGDRRRLHCHLFTDGAAGAAPNTKDSG